MEEEAVSTYVWWDDWPTVCKLPGCSHQHRQTNKREKLKNQNCSISKRKGKTRQNGTEQQSALPCITPVCVCVRVCLGICRVLRADGQLYLCRITIPAIQTGDSNVTTMCHNPHIITMTATVFEWDGVLLCKGSMHMWAAAACQYLSLCLDI